jgi:cell division protein FtsA
MASKQEFAVVIDIGSIKITALAGEKAANGKINILGQAMVPSRGIKRGVVLNTEEFAIALKDLVFKIESQVEDKIKTLDISMAGMGITTTVYQGVRHIESGMVSQFDVDYLENEASKTPLEPGYRLYHMFLRRYEIGDDPNVTVPVGHEGRKLSAWYTIIAAPSSYRESIEKALARIGIQLRNFVLSPLAIAEAVLTSEEKDLGVVSMDIGGGTTKISSFQDGRLIQMAAIPFGGEVITRDLKEALSILQKKAEQLKTEYGQAIGDFAEDGKFVAIPGSEGWEHKEISFKSLAYIIQARLEEIIDSIYMYIEKSGFLENTSQGIVITGGASKLINLLQLVKFRTGMDARLGFSQVRLAETVDLDKTAFIGALGMLKIALRNSQQVQGPRQPGSTKERGKTSRSGSKFLSNLGEKFSQQIRLIFEDDNVNS